MSKLIALAQLLFSPLLLLLSACGVGGTGTTYSNRVAADGHDVLYSKARVNADGARFECKASDSGACHYTLYPDACAGKADCALAPLQRFSVSRGQSRQIAGLRNFRVCVGTEAQPVRADCKQAATN